MGKVSSWAPDLIRLSCAILLGVAVLNDSVISQTVKRTESVSSLPWDTELQYLGGTPVLSLRRQMRIPDNDISVVRNQLNRQRGGIRVSDSFEPLMFESVPGPYGGTVRSITKDNQGRLFLATDGGVYRSTDNGLHWEGNLFPTQLYNTVEPVTVIGPDIIAAETDFGSFISTDAGDSWSYSSFHAFASDTNGDVYASTGYFGLWKSLDNGKSWKPTGLTGVKIYRVALCGGGRIVCSSDSGSFFSEDAGSSWLFRRSGTDFGHYIISDRHGRLFSFESSTICISNDFGSTWKLIALPDSLDYDYVYRIYAEPDDRLFALTSNSAYVSSDSGETWEPMRGPSTPVLSIGEDLDGNVLAGTFKGIYRQDTGTNRWQEISDGIHSMRIERIQFTARGSILVLSLGECYRSTDAGDHWSEVTVDSGDYINSYAPILLTSSGDLFLVASGSLLFRSKDDGVSWQHVDVPTIHYPVNGVTERVPGEILVATSHGDIFRSTDEATSWSQVLSSPVSSPIRWLGSDRSGHCYAVNDSAVLVSDDGKIWKQTALDFGYGQFCSMAVDNEDGVYLASTYNGVYYTSDHGSTWLMLNTGPGDKYIGSSAADDSGGVYIGTATGIIGLADSVDDWVPISEGFPSTFTTALSVSPDGYIYGGTQSYGLYRSVSPARKRFRTNLPPSGQAVQIGLRQNYPNPFNPVTRIDYSVSRSGHVTLKVFDVLGRAVRTVVDETQSAGYHHVTFNSTGLASGVYFYSVQSAGKVQTKKLVILK